LNGVLQAGVNHARDDRHAARHRFDRRLKHREALALVQGDKFACAADGDDARDARCELRLDVRLHGRRDDVAVLVQRRAGCRDDASVALGGVHGGVTKGLPRNLLIQHGKGFSIRGADADY
jgi:hypothetical protein